MATAEKYPVTVPRHYVWWFPGSPVKVYLDLHVIEQLQERLRDTGPGVTEQGLLFGSTPEGATEVSDFEPAYNRSVPDMIAALPEEQRKHLLVGYYRAEWGDTLRLNENDSSLAKQCFAEAYQVFLVIQPNGFAPPNAAFFFHDGSHQMAELALMEFPFDASLLATEERDRIRRSQQATIEQPVAIQPPTFPESNGPRTAGRGVLKKAALFLFAVVIGAATLINIPSLQERLSPIWKAFSNPPTTTAPSAPPSSHPVIGLHAKRQDRDLELTWNRESAWIATATSGLISIDDGSSKRQIALDSKQLRDGSILYSPATDQVLIQLAVSTPTGAVTEAVTVIFAQSDKPQTHSVEVSGPFSGAALGQRAGSNSTPAVQAPKPFTLPPTTNPRSPMAPPLNEPPALWSNPNPVPAPASIDIVQTSGPPLMPRSAASKEPLEDAPSNSLHPPAASTSPAYHPPVPTRKITPEFPMELKSVIIKPQVVEVRVTIDKTGKVLRAEPVNQGNIHKLLIDAALRAAPFWKFQPARRGEEPVLSETILRFVFTP